MTDFSEVGVSGMVHDICSDLFAHFFVWLSVSGPDQVRKTGGGRGPKLGRGPGATQTAGGVQTVTVFRTRLKTEVPFSDVVVVMGSVL